MKRKRYTDEQIAFAPRQAEAGTQVEEICRKLGVSEPTVCLPPGAHSREITAG
jgi:putative transposase